MKKPFSSLLKKYWLLILATALLLVAIGILIVASLSPADKSSINSFADCARAGYPIQESFPETCSVPGGKTFVNN